MTTLKKTFHWLFIGVLWTLRDYLLFPSPTVSQYLTVFLGKLPRTIKCYPWVFASLYLNTALTCFDTIYHPIIMLAIKLHQTSLLTRPHKAKAQNLIFRLAALSYTINRESLMNYELYVNITKKKIIIFLKCDLINSCHHKI